APALQAPSGLWRRDHWVYIPFSAPPSYPRISVADILRGKVDPAFWTGKIVLIGATATGLGDAYPTSASADAQYMPGVEISANLIQALRSGRGWQLLPAWQNGALTLLLTALALPLIVRSRPWRGLVIMATMLLLIVGLMLWMLDQADINWHPVAAALSVSALYFIWNARRLEFALQYLLKELKHIRQLLPEREQSVPPSSSSVDVVNRDILQLTDA